MATEDLTLYTEVDGNGDLTVTASKIDFVTMPANVTDYVYDDKGANHWNGDFNIAFEFEITGTTGSNVQGILTSLSDVIGVPNNSTSLMTYYETSSLTPYLADISSAGAWSAWAGGSNLALTTRYYCDLIRTTNTLDWDLYSDSAKTTLVQNITITIANTAQTFRYIYPMSSIDIGDASDVTGYVQNVDLNEATAVNINATTDSLVTTTYPSSVNAAVNIAASLDSLLITENASSIALNVDISATVDALTISEKAASINASKIIAASTAALSITENAASLSVDSNISATSDAITLTEYAASINAAVNIQTNTDALIVTDYAAGVSLGINISANTDSLLMTENSAFINTSSNILAGFDSLIISEYASSIASGIVSPTPSERVELIGAENRVTGVEAENRINLILSENRIFPIAYEDRNYSVKSDNRINIISGD